MLKPSASLFESDPRFREMIAHDPIGGETRLMRIEDLRGMVAQIELGSAVPKEIRDQFDIARNAFVYSWFVYEFATLAEQQCFATLEMALRRRLYPAPPNTSKSPGLGKLLKAATDRGCLLRKDFEMPSPFGPGEMACSLDLIPNFRNHVMHGNIHILPQDTPNMMRLCAIVMNKLFPSENGDA